jgi:hypothetical protein
MNVKIENPATCEMRPLIRFLSTTNIRPAEIHRQIVEVHGEDAINEWRMTSAGCSKAAGLMCMARNEVGARLWSRTI